MNFFSVLEAGHRAIKAALSNVGETEPQLVAKLVWHIAKEMRAVAGLKANGVFVHATPHVKSNNFPKAKPQSVEIGDLLLLRGETRGKGLRNRAALLLQAKKVQSLHTTPDNANQYYLYVHWPQFTYVRGMNKLTGRKRKLVGGDIVDACQYLLIGGAAATCPSFPVPYPYGSSLFPHWAATAHASMSSLTHYQCFLQGLTEFILGNGGKRYDRPAPKRTCGWDRVVNELVEVTGEKVNSYVKNAGSTSGERLCFLIGDFAPSGFLAETIRGADMSHLAQTDNGSDPPEVAAERPTDPGTLGGISIIEFVISNEENAPAPDEKE